MPVITFMTDFGIKDGNVGVMKGVIWGITPDAQISDLSHMVQAQNIREAAYILGRSVPFFPAGTIHIVVVDPGVGTARRPMAARIGDWFYVGPDNGTLTVWLERAENEAWPCEFVHLNQPKFWLPVVSHVFHGRDIFSPVAAHLARGVALNDLGTPFTDPVRISLPQPVRTANGWRGEVVHIDHFGNLASNIRVEHLGDAFRQKNKIIVRLNSTEVHGIVDTFGERQSGELVALLGSTGNLVLSVVNGNAASKLKAELGDVIEAELP